MICIHEQALGSDLAERIQKRYPADRVRIVKSREEAEEEAGRLGLEKPGTSHRLFITREMGRFLKPCPGTPGMKCCNLFVLNHLIGCAYDCTYCFLQSWRQGSLITMFANLDDLEKEVDALLAANRGKLVRICTGELADSLALDGEANVNQRLVGLFAKREGALLELKTKSARIDPLLDLDHRGRTVLSWSMNTDEAASEELLAPSPAQRLQAAKKAVLANYPLAFHFDPIVRTTNWEASYGLRIKELFETVPADSIKWISLGGFRYTPAMKTMICSRFPQTRLFLDEFIGCGDGKFRYFSKIRIGIYRRLLNQIRQYGPKVPVYLCMESDYVWKRVFGALPENLPLLDPIFTPGCYPD